MRWDDLWLLVPIGLFVWHMARLGTYYIEFDGQSYWVWRRAFLGYNDCKGRFLSEASAKVAVRGLMENPPRNIKP